MEVAEGGDNRLPGNVLHDGVLGNGNGPRLSCGDDMIAFDDEHGVLDCRPAGPINQPRAFEHDPLRLGLRSSAEVNHKHRQESSQDHQSVRAFDDFHLASPYYYQPWIL